jgi:ABC-2 type transport system ATP-binding protein
VLRALNLTRRFGERTAVADVSFEIQRGEVFGLLGPNGAGKTTTLRMLGGLILPTTGSVSLDGAPMNRRTVDAARRRIGFLTETPGLWEALSVFDNVRTYGRLFGVTDAEVASERLLRRFALWERRDDRVAQLSKGMKQKLAVARALVHDPEIVLLDEPTANLDPQTAREVRDLIAELRDRGRVVIVSTHNLDEVERIASRIALISTRLIAIGEPSALRGDVFGRRVRVTLAGGVSFPMQIDQPERDIPAIVAALVHGGAAICDVREERPPLEEVYMRLLKRQPS